MKTKTIFFLALLFTGSSCGFVGKSILHDNPTGTIFPASQVEVFFEEDDLPQHTKIAIITGKGGDIHKNEKEITSKLREEAGRLGANAIVLKVSKDADNGEKLVTTPFGTYNKQKKCEAIAIYSASLDSRVDMARAQNNSTLNFISANDVPAPQGIGVLPGLNASGEQVAVETENTESHSKQIPDTFPADKSETSLPNLRKAAPNLDKYSDKQIIATYRKRYPELERVSNEEVARILDSKYAR